MPADSDPSEILIGTSGWSYDDWVGPFYPEALKLKKSDWLGYYGKFFYTTEINSTFYRMPNPKMVDRWIDVAGRLDGFEFSVKLPQAVTHEALVKGNKDEARSVAKDFEYIVAKPLAEKDMLGCILIQLSPFFRRYEQRTNADNLESLEKLFGALSYSEHMYVAEFRHSSWLNNTRDDLDKETLKLLSEYNIGVCKTDGPGFPITATDTAPHEYIRLHGRNQDIWFKGKKFEEEKKRAGPTGDPRMNRYDYLYTEDELKYWVPMVKKASTSKKKSNRLYFNNHPHGQAIQNAFMMMDLVGMPRKTKELKLQKQYKIDSF